MVVGNYNAMSDPVDHQKGESKLIVPAWGDDFDLTKFFGKLEPNCVQFRDSHDLASAQELFKLVQRLILRWVGLNRSLVRAANAHPEAVARVVECVRKMGSMDWNTYCAWFAMPDENFEGTSPHDWFMRNGLEEFAPLLGVGQKAPSGGQIVALGTIYSGGEPPGSQAVTPCRGTNEPSPRSENIVGLLTRFRQLADPAREPAFDLRPILERCKPQNQKFASTSDRLLASEVFMILEAESFGWLSLYRFALGIARERGGIISKIVLCLQRLQWLGFERYLAWFRSAQAEFGDRSPESFFVAEGFVSLALLLGAGGVDLP